MGIKKPLLYKVLLKNKKIALFYGGYKVAKFGWGLYRKKKKVRKTG